MLPTFYFILSESKGGVQCLHLQGLAFGDKRETSAHHLGNKCHTAGTLVDNRTIVPRIGSE